MNTDKSETAWKLAVRLGCIANQLDLWADECLVDGWDVHQVETMRGLAREIRAKLYGFVPSDETLQDVITVARTFVDDVLRQCALYSNESAPIREYPTAQRLKSAMRELEKMLVNSSAQ